MMKKLRKDAGIPLCIIFAYIFIMLSKFLYPHFYGVYWYYVNGSQRLLFFAVELIIFIKLFKKESIKEVLHFRHFRAGLFCGVGAYVFVVFHLITYCLIGAKSWRSTTVLEVLSFLIFQQFATGLWEEMTFRAFVCEGYFQGEKKTPGRRILYAFISLLIFGLAHAIECTSMEQAIYRFISTGVWGFTFAVVYLQTHNLLAAAFLHFFIDIFLNFNHFIVAWNESTALTILDNYVQWIILAGMLIAGIIILLKEPKSSTDT